MFLGGVGTIIGLPSASASGNSAAAFASVARCLFPGKGTAGARGIGVPLSPMGAGPKHSSQRSSIEQSSNAFRWVCDGSDVDGCDDGDSHSRKHENADALCVHTVLCVCV